MDPALALDRAGARQDREDRFEQRGLAFQQDLRARFHEIAAANPCRCRIIDAGQDSEAPNFDRNDGDD